MDAEIIILIIMGVLLISWVIGITVSFFHRIKKLQIQSGMVAHVKCEKCGTEYDVSAESFTKTFLTKQYTMTKTKVQGNVWDNSPNYVYYAKKFQCPNCNRKRYAQVLNLNEMIQQNRPIALREGIKYLALMMLGGMIIMYLTKIPMSIAQKQAEKRAQEQMWEEHFWKNYSYK